MNKKRVVITGIGIIAANGIRKDNFWQSNIQIISGVSDIDCFNTSNLILKKYNNKEI